MLETRQNQNRGLVSKTYFVSIIISKSYYLIAFVVDIFSLWFNVDDTEKEKLRFSVSIRIE